MADLLVDPMVDRTADLLVDPMADLLVGKFSRKGRRRRFLASEILILVNTSNRYYLPDVELKQSEQSDIRAEAHYY